jgi:hypothetical protein
MTEGPARSREALLDHIYRRGTRYRRRRRLAQAGLALACVAGLVLVALPLQGSSAGEDQRVVTDEGKGRRDVERASTPEDEGSAEGPSTTGTLIPPPDDRPPDPSSPPRPGPTVVPNPADRANPEPDPEPPPPAPPARTWTAAPLSGPAGTVITASGTGCTTAPVVVTMSGDGMYLSGGAGQGVPDRSGSWTASLTVPADSPNYGGRDEYSLAAWCGEPVIGTPDFMYEAGWTFDVTGPVTVPPQLTLSPTSGPPGSLVEVTGTRCTASRAEVATFLSMDLVAEVEVPVTGGSFRATVRVPEDADPGYDLVVHADCGVDYPPGVFDIRR